MTKYRAKRTRVGEYMFDSQAEADRYRLLRQQELYKMISDLKLQPKFEFPIAGIPLRSEKGRVLFYKADFWYKHKGEIFVEDVKGMVTPVWKLKWALVKHIYPQYIWKAIKRKKGNWVEI